MSLRGAIDQLLRDGLPGLFGGGTPAVTLTVERAELTIEPLPRTAAEAEPRTHDALDLLSFDPARPPGPYLLGRVPAAGPRRLFLQRDAGRITLRDNEVVWDAAEPRRFTLALDGRDLTGVTGVGVRYSVVAVRTYAMAAQTVRIGLVATDADAVDRAEALVLAALAAEQDRLATASRAEYADGSFGATVTTEAVEVTGSIERSGGGRTIQVRARVRLDGSRALRADEGHRIAHIRNPGVPLRPDHPVDVPIDVDA